MSVPPPPTVAAVVVRAPALPPSPADRVFSIIRLAPETIRTATRLDDALASVPGVSLFRRVSSLGANPTTQGVSLRGIAGSGASRALVTLDGAPQNDPFGGWVIWTSLPPETIGAVDVVRGAGAGPYGAGALTGVVALRSPSLQAGDWRADASAGGLGQARAAATTAIQAGPVLADLYAAGEHSDGWIPVREGRGAADTKLGLTDWAAGGRFLADIGGADAAARISAYGEDRGAGLRGAGSRETGGSLSLTAAKPPVGDAPGWRAQAWLLASDLANTSVSVSANRQTTSLADQEYQTPALGYGGNLEVRRAWTSATLELGVDLRGAGGEDRERFDSIGGVLTKRRLAGGETVIGGAYLEGTRQVGPLLLAAGGRLDAWSTFDAHLIESELATGAVTLDSRPGETGGVTPSGRIGARWTIDPNLWLRAAAYTGFRPPTLNELFRPFRVGNNLTEANAALRPERLEGVETGIGGSPGPLSWSITAFYNRLIDPVTNVTIARGPFSSPTAGFVPAGGVLLERENVGAIDAVGLEAEGSARLTSSLTATAAFSLTRARVDGGTAAPRLNGLRPAETPRSVVTAGAAWRVLGRFFLLANLRYEGLRYEDDQNLLPLAPATTIDASLEWRANPRLTLFVSAANLFDVAVQQDDTATGVHSYGPPRTLLVGFRIAGGRTTD